MNPFKDKQILKVLKKYITEDNIKKLEKLWNLPYRYYHNINHLVDIIFNIKNDVRFTDLNVQEKHILLLAAIFHDAIYEPKQKDNEDMSIKLFNVMCIKLNTDIKENVIECIEATKYRKRPISKLPQMLWDADNKGFIGNYQKFLNIEHLIRKEFSFIGNVEYKTNRIKFLESNIGLFNKTGDENIKKLIKYIEKTY